MTIVTKLAPTGAALLVFLVATRVFTADPTTVNIDNFVFQPAQITVKAGTKITFINRDDLPHSVIDVKGAFRSKALDTDDSFTQSFDKPGEIDYFCGLHPQMKGKIIVTP